MPTFDPYRVQCNDISINVVDLQFFDANPDLDLDFHFFADPIPDPAFHFNPVMQIHIRLFALMWKHPVFFADSDPYTK
jgi:hypothetical protein